MNNFDTLRTLLDRIARLGNEPHLGNSEGNVLAQDAIKALEAIEADHFTAADMADAQAKAFRDGVASVAGQEPVDQFRSPHCSDWYDGVPDHHDGHGPYEVRTLYRAAPVAQQQGSNHGN